MQVDSKRLLLFEEVGASVVGAWVRLKIIIDSLRNVCCQRFEVSLIRLEVQLFGNLFNQTSQILWVFLLSQVSFFRCTFVKDYLSWLLLLDVLSCRFEERFRYLILRDHISPSVRLLVP